MTEPEPQVVVGYVLMLAKKLIKEEKIANEILPCCHRGALTSGWVFTRQIRIRFGRINIPKMSPSCPLHERVR